MSREEKRRIRIQIHELIENECMGCQYRRGYENASFCVTWTEEEVFYLSNHLDLYNVPHLAARLNRTPSSVYTKVNSLKKRQKRVIC